MEKYIECHNCQNQYDCERTYLGGCTDGKEWEDDKDINVRSKKILANRVYSDTTLKKWSKEDLIEHIRILEHNWACAEENLNNSVKNSEKIFYEQKAEIERLTEREKFLDSAWKNSLKTTETVERGLKASEARNAELQKQVDELTKQREVGREKLKNEIANKIFMSASHGAIQCGKMSIAIAEIEAEKYVEFAWEMVQQAVKDTAKDIATELLKTKIKIGNEYYVFANNIKVIAKRKGVEVE